MRNHRCLEHVILEITDEARAKLDSYGYTDVSVKVVALSRGKAICKFGFIGKEDDLEYQGSERQMGPRGYAF